MLARFLAALIAALSLLLGSCKTTEEGDLEPNWPAITQAIEIGAVTIEQMAEVFPEPKRSEWLAVATAARGTSQELHVWVVAGEPPTGAQLVAVSLQAVVSSFGPLLVDEDDVGLRAALVGLQGALKIAAVFVPGSTLPDPTEEEVEAARELTDVPL